jgi:Asp/Glu/hydantoin racemase
MKRKTLGLIHTSAPLVPAFAQLCRVRLPQVDTFNIVDDSFVRLITAHGSLTSDLVERVAGYIRSAVSGGADFVLVTCSSIGPAVEAAAPRAGVPVMRVDQPMADRAVRHGRRVGVVATLATTMQPTTHLLRDRARAAGRNVEITARLCEGAFDALAAGDGAKHDALVSAVVRELSSQVDVIVLAQASMARIVDAMGEIEKSVPVLASPALAIDHLATVL